MVTGDKLIFVFYGRKPRQPGVNVMNGATLAAELFAGYGLSVQYVSFKSSARILGLKEGKLYDHRRTGTKILAEAAKGQITMIEFSRVASDEHASGCFDWLTGFSTGALEKGDCVYYQFGVDMGLCRGMPGRCSLAAVLDVCQKMHTLAQAKYGFVVTMPHGSFPASYGAGYAGGSDSKIVMDANMWRAGACREYANTLRNIYALNFVSMNHLSAKIGGVTLKRWAELSPKRGRLEQWTDELWLWRIDKGIDWPELLHWNNPVLTNMRTELEDHGIFAWQRPIDAL